MHLLDHPVVLAILCFVAMWFVARAGAYLRGKRGNLESSELDELGVIVGAALTLLALITGFSFSMATGRYDLRKNYEEEEANAIGTEYNRVGLLPAADADRARTLLREYLTQRILFYETRDAGRLAQISASTAQLQSDLWSAVQAPAIAQPSVLTSLAASGMNDVLNSEGYTQAAWWNRIPRAAWILLVSIGLFGNALLGYRTQQAGKKGKLFFALPLLIAVAFLLIADLDSPRGGVISVSPQNLVRLSQSLPPK